MSELFPRRPPADATEAEPLETVDPRRERERQRWELPTARWRARELAEAVFGGEVRVTPSGGSALSFRGLLTMEVPFRDLDDHRAREGIFVACAGRDPVLSRVPVVFVFEPRPVYSVESPA